MTSDQDGQEGLTLVAALDLAPRTPSSKAVAAPVAGARPPVGPSSTAAGVRDAYKTAGVARTSDPRPAPPAPELGADLIRVILRR